MAQPQKKLHQFLKCPVCGKSGARTVFTLGSLGRIPLQQLQYRVVAKGQGFTRDGQRGGTFIWQRRPMTEDEALIVGAAVATAAHRIEEYVEESLPRVARAEQILAEVESDAEFLDVAREWIEEAERELEMRRRLIADEAERRRMG